VGRQHGQALRSTIRAHLELIYTQGAQRSNLAPDPARRWALAFGPTIGEAALRRGDRGRGRGRGHRAVGQVAHVARVGAVDLECTSFAVSGPSTRTSGTLAGQNADLAGGIEAFSAVLTFAVTGKPAVMMLVPAGQISYLGISSEGLASSRNLLLGDRAGSMVDVEPTAQEHGLQWGELHDSGCRQDRIDVRYEVRP
jgi:hypothetical protein